MSITERLMGLGRWTLRLKDIDPETIDRLDHLIVTRQRVDHDALGDAGMLAASAYTGVITKRRTDPGLVMELSGQGLEWWLADSDDKGFVYETARNYSADSFADVLNRSGSTPYGLLRDDSANFLAIQAGTINSVAGTYTGTHRLESQRKAIRYVCDVFDAEYRVNPDGTFDAGTESDLFTTTPTAVIAAKSGLDPNYEGIRGELSTEKDIDDYTTRTLLLAEGEGGDSVAIGTADAVSVPYKDLFGNTVVRVRLISEAETSTGNADTRAQLHQNRFSSEREALTLTADEYEIDGSFQPGDSVYVYDPAQGLEDTANEVVFRGQTIHPVVIRILGWSWPVTEGMGVYHRDLNGNYTDLTDHVDWESGSTQLEVGANPRRLTDSDDQAIRGRVNSPYESDTAIPDTPTHANTPWGTSSYVDAEGRTRAQINVEWSEPLNTDGSTITDGSHYVIRWRRTGESDYQYTSVPWSTSLFILQDLAPGVTYEISVAAFDFGGRSGGYAADESVAASSDTTPPSQPAAPTVAGNPLNIQVSHDLGKQSGGTFNLESDIDHLNVYASTTSGFTPAEANRIGQIPATVGHLNLGITVIGTFPFADVATRYVKVTAVDKAGNESTPSAQASVSATLIDTAHITDASITTAKINDLAVTNAKIALLAVDTAQIADLAVETAKIDDLAVTQAKIANLAVDTAQIADAAIETAKIDNLAVTTGKIDDLAVTNAKIANATIQSAKISDLAVDKLTGGSINTTEITIASTLTMGTGGIIRTGTSGERIEIQESSADRILFYSGAGSETAAAYIQVQDDLGNPKLRIQAHNSDNTYIDWATVGGTLRLQGETQVRVTADTGPSGLRIISATLDDAHGQTGEFFIKLDAAGTAGAPIYTFIGDTDTGIWRSAADQLSFGAGGAELLRLDENGEDHVLIPMEVQLEWRDASFNDSGRRNRMYMDDSDFDAWKFEQSDSGSSWAMVLGVYDHSTYSHTIRDDTTGSAASVFINATDGRIQRSTSALAYKTHVTRDVDYLADIDLVPTKHYRDDDGRWRYGLVADWLAAQDPLLGEYAAGVIENYDDRAVLAVLAAKVNRYGERITALEQAAA